MKHFLKETDLSPTEVGEVFSRAREYKRGRGKKATPDLAGQTWALVFAKSSTRTRVSFEVGINELGGHALYLNRNDIQLGRGESVEDTARVLSRFVHGIVIRTYDHGEVERLAAASSVPVVNGLTDLLHPCQIYADAFTAAERWAGPGGSRGRRAQGPQDSLPRRHQLQHGQFLDPRGQPLRHEDIPRRSGGEASNPRERIRFARQGRGARCGALSSRPTQ